MECVFYSEKNSVIKILIVLALIIMVLSVLFNLNSIIEDLLRDEEAATTISILDRPLKNFKRTID